MASRLLGLLSLIAATGSCLAGVATYAYNPYVATYHAPAATVATAVTYASHAPIYHQHHPLVYHQHAVPLVSSAAAAAVPVYTKTFAAPAVAPVVAKHTYAAAPLSVVKAAAVVAPVAKAVELEASPRYDFSYGVHDSITGDIKSHVETRDGGNVAGSYSVIDADGYKRTVTYTADDLNGFNAVVQREPIVAKLAAVASAVPVVSHLAPAPVPVAASPVVSHFAPVPAPAAVVAQEPAAAEPVPVEYPQQQEQQAEAQYPQDQQFPPYPQAPQAADSDDSEVVDVRSVSTNADANADANQEQKAAASSTTAAPAPVSEEQSAQQPQTKTA